MDQLLSCQFLVICPRTERDKERSRDTFVEIAREDEHEEGQTTADDTKQ
jgi:hypothetical protein